MYILRRSYTENLSFADQKDLQNVIQYLSSYYCRLYL